MAIATTFWAVGAIVGAATLLLSGARDDFGRGADAVAAAILWPLIIVGYAAIAIAAALILGCESLGRFGRKMRGRMNIRAGEVEE